MRRCLAIFILFTALGLGVSLLAQNTVITNPRITGVQSGAVTVGTGTATAKIGGTLFWVNDARGNLADTNWVISSVYALPANSLTTNGDRLEIEAQFSFSAAVSTKSWDCRIGYSSFSVASGFTGGYTLHAANTASTSVGVSIRTASITRQSATTGGGSSMAFVGPNTTLNTTTYQTGQALTWANANNIACAVKDSVGAANSEIIQELRVSYVPR